MIDLDARNVLVAGHSWCLIRSTTTLMFNAVKLLVLLLVLAATALSVPRNPCRCRGLLQGAPTMGNLFGTLSAGSMRIIQGTAFYPNTGKRVNEAIIEVYENSSKFNDANIPYSEVDKIIAQQPKAACMTGSDGKFCFTDLPPGKYLLRIGTHGENQFSGINVLITLDPRSKRPSPKPLKVELNISL
jgi:hypothetical protein